MNPGQRPPAVAGVFYPQSPAALTAEVAGLLARAHGPALLAKALVVPHAGYIYSGETAAAAYATLASRRAVIRRVILLGPTHRVAVHGLALPASSAFTTPLGTIPIDASAVAAIADLPQVVVSDAAHALEHSLEVQLPFLQCVLDAFTLLPLAVGDASPAEVAEVLERLWGGSETLLVISSDLSHYLPYDMARSSDARTARHILALDPHIDHQQACGATPLNGLLLAARRRGLQATQLSLCNSGDSVANSVAKPAGDKSRVVGYGAFAFSEASAAPHLPHDDQENPAMPDRGLGRALLTLARNAIGERFAQPPRPLEDLPRLAEYGATFVTLSKNGALRGCIGSLEAQRPLREDIEANAVAAAFADPRFAPLTADEFQHTHIEVSLLGTAESIDLPQGRGKAADEAAALARLRPGVDGVILSHDGRRATFLPQVWETLPDPARFLAQLKQKAGLPPDFWDERIQLARYEVQKWKETN